jgi:uncharacterized membrane protein YfcA
LNAAELAALGLAALVGSGAQSAMGFGAALPVSPVAFALLKPADAVLTVEVVGLAQNLLVLLTRHRHLDLRGADCALLLAAAIPGVLLGALIITHVARPPMQLLVGVALLTAVLFRVHEPGRAPLLDRRFAAAPVGLLAGILTTTVGINGPPMVIWLRARGVTLTQLRDTLAVVFLGLSLVGIPSLLARGGSIPPAAIGPLAAGLVLGHVLGSLAHQRVAISRLERSLAVVLTVAAGASIAGAVLALA